MDGFYASLEKRKEIMLLWLLPALKVIGDILWHAIKRFWSVFLIGLIILSIGLWVRGYKAKLYNEGYKCGYSTCIKERPTYGNVGVVNNAARKIVGFSVWRIYFGLIRE